MLSNQRAIQAITTWVNGISKTLTVLQLDNYQGYDFKGSPGEVTYTLCEEVTDQGITTTNGIVCGIVPLTWPLVDAWGADDQPIFDYVAQQLNLQLI